MQICHRPPRRICQVSPTGLPYLPFVSVPYGAVCCKNIIIVPKPGHYNYGFPKFLAKLKRTPNMLRLGDTWGGREGGSAAHELTSPQSGTMESENRVGVVIF